MTCRRLSGSRSVYIWAQRAGHSERRPHTTFEFADQGTWQTEPRTLFLGELVL